MYDGSAWQDLSSSIADLSTYQKTSRTGLISVVPTSVSVGSGSASVATNGTVTFSGASSVSVDGIFSTTYDSYKVVFLSKNSSTAVWIRSRWRKNSSDDTNGAYYHITTESNSSTGPVKVLYGAQNNFMAGITGNFMHGTIDMTISNPAATDKVVSWLSLSQGYGAGTHYLTNNGGFYDSPGTSIYGWTGMTFFPDTGTISGTIRIYGYNNNA